MNKNTRKDIINLINEERNHQVRMWGNDENKSVGDFLTFIRIYLHAAEGYYTCSNTPETLHALRKITALGVAALERHLT